MTIIERVRNPHPLLKPGPVRRLVAAFGLACVLGIGSSGCSLRGDALQQKTTPEENHKFQRITAVALVKDWPNVEMVSFTQEGSFSGSGQWATNAIVTIGPEKYQEILGPWTMVGDQLPEPDRSLPPRRVTVTYSDGTSEVLE